jgi:hypothetical protein
MPHAAALQQEVFHRRRAARNDWDVTIINGNIFPPDITLKRKLKIA